jgi:2-haloacid dehalogenase
MQPSPAADPVQQGRRAVLLTIAGILLAGHARAAPKTDILHPDPPAPFDANAIRALAFDIQGSILDYYTPLAQMLQRINEQKHLNLDVEAFITQWRDGYHNVIDAILSGRSAWIPTERVYADALDALLDRERLSEQFSRSERVEMTGVWGQMIPWPDTAAGLGRLRQKYILTTLSNAGMQTVGKMIKMLDLRFDYILTGELAHSFKPDGGVYRLVPSNLGVPVEAVLMVACHKYDLKGAHDFGFRTAYIPRPFEFGPNGKLDTQAEPYIDIMADDLNDLAARLAA